MVIGCNEDLRVAIGGYLAMLVLIRKMMPLPVTVMLMTLVAEDQRAQGEPFPESKVSSVYVIDHLYFICYFVLNRLEIFLAISY